MLIGIRHFIYITTTQRLIDSINTGNPVTMMRFITITLVIILTTYIVPHKVAPEHLIHLVGHKDPKVISCTWRLVRSQAQCITVIAHISSTVIVTPNSWEEMLLCIIDFNVMSHNLIGSFAITGYRQVNRVTLLGTILCIKILTSKEWSRTVLCTLQIRNKRHHIIRIGHIDRHPGIGTNDRRHITSVTDSHKC